MLEPDVVRRHSRQMLVPEFGGPAAQRALGEAAVLVVGAGGLGATLLPYLAGAGVGRLTVVDDDVIDRSNLGRQILFKDAQVGLAKAKAARDFLRELNPAVHVEARVERLSAANAAALVAAHDVVCDATDNPGTRYLLSDACVLAGGKPLVSGGAIGLEGTVTVYCAPGAPCYRCLYPAPPPPGAQTDCASGGVLGPVPGLVGCLQAIEVIKLLAGMGDAIQDRQLLVDAEAGATHAFRLGGRRRDCAACGAEPTVLALDEAFYCACSGSGVADDLDAALRVSCAEAAACPDALLLDVRSPLQFSMCALDGAVSMPLDALDVARVRELQGAPERPVLVLCRRGIDSVVATKRLVEAGVAAARNVDGGLRAWAEEVDGSFPSY